jgi:hypothetical protein
LGAFPGTLAAVLYTAKCFWPGATTEDVELAAGRVTTATARFRAALFLPREELVLCLFESASSTDVKRASEDAGLPCERVIETVWIETEGEST